MLSASPFADMPMSPLIGIWVSPIMSNQCFSPNTHTL